MEEIYDRWIRGRQSMVALTDKSEVFKTKFADLVKAEGDSRVANMRWAKHRHESMVRPLGRSVLNISAQLELAAWVVTTRHGAVEAKVAKSWLEWMDEERYIQACMMADGGDEVMLLLRYMDNEEMAVEESMDRVWLLRKHLFFLFGPERGCKKVGGGTPRKGWPMSSDPATWWHEGRSSSSAGPRSMSTASWTGAWRGCTRGWSLIPRDIWRRIAYSLSSGALGHGSKVRGPSVLAQTHRPCAVWGQAQLQGGLVW